LTGQPCCDWCGKPAVILTYRTLYVDTEFENTSKYFECEACSQKRTEDLTTEEMI